MTEILNMQVFGDPKYIEVSKMAVGSIAAINEFDLERVDDVQVAIGEACKAITCHEHEMWSAKYQVVAELNDNGSEMVVTVNAVAADHCISKDLTRRPCMDCPNEGAIGIYVIKSLVDDVEIVRQNDGCNKIRMVIKK